MMGELRIGDEVIDDAAGGGGEGDDGFEDGLLNATLVGVEVMSWTGGEHSITAGNSSSPSICNAGRRVAVVVVVGSAMFRCCVVALVCLTIGSTPA